MMRELRRVTEEEEQLLAGGQVDKSLYSSSPSFLIDSEKLLAKGRRKYASDIMELAREISVG